MSKKIIILGAGPCGLAAAYKLQKLGINDYHVFEKNSYPGGLCASFKDQKGFTWDLGGHVFSSINDEVNQFFDDVMHNEWIYHIRDSYIYYLNKHIPYPIQRNLRHLPKDKLLECLTDLINTDKTKISKNLDQWLNNKFGTALYKYFLQPYNQKLWQTPLCDMDYLWTKGYVPPVNIKETLENIIFEKDCNSWGKNYKFRYPKTQGTAKPFKNIANTLKDKITYNKEAIKIDAINRVVFFDDSSSVNYDYLINTSPLDSFVQMLNSNFDNLKNASSNLQHNSIFIVGIGTSNRINKGSWIYFSDKNHPFYRLTFLSKYSAKMTPDPINNSSYLAEISFSNKEIDESRLVEDTINCLHDDNFFDKNTIKSVYTKTIKKAYPIPLTQRDAALNLIFGNLEQLNIFSRGWLGSWKYEVGNMEYSIKQGLEVVDKILFLKPESTVHNNCL